MRGAARLGSAGAKPVASGAHKGLKAAAAEALRATRRRPRVQFARNAPARAGKAQRRIVPARVGAAHAEPGAEGAKRQRRTVAGQPRPKVPKPAAPMDAAEEDVLARAASPAAHRAEPHAANPVERPIGEA